MNRFKTVLKFEYLGYVKSTSWRVTTIIFAVVLFIGTAIPHLVGIFSKLGGDKESVLFVVEEAADTAAPDAASLVDYLNTYADDYAWTAGEADADPEQLITDKTYDMVVEYGGGDTYTLYGASSSFSVYSVQAVLDSALTEALRASSLAALPANEQETVNEFLTLQVTGGIKTVGEGGAMQNFYLSYIMIYLLFIVLMMYGQFVVTSVVNEKSTKTMELLITSAKPTELMAGKVLGIGLVALTQFGLYIAIGIIGMMVNFGAWEKQFPAVAEALKNASFSPVIVVLLIVFFVLGYLLYAFIYAALGATVSKMEDASAVTSIPIFLLMIFFFISMFAMQDADSTFMKVVSYIPLATPFTMFARASMGEAGVLPVAISLVVLTLTVALMAWLGAKIYRVGVMMYGKPMKLKGIIGAVRAGNGSRL
jgi:ABC-2 type transport system permease protein